MSTKWGRWSKMPKCCQRSLWTSPKGSKTIFLAHYTPTAYTICSKSYKAMFNSYKFWPTIKYEALKRKRRNYVVLRSSLLQTTPRTYLTLHIIGCLLSIIWQYTVNLLRLISYFWKPFVTNSESNNKEQWCGDIPWSHFVLKHSMG